MASYPFISYLLDYSAVPEHFQLCCLGSHRRKALVLLSVSVILYWSYHYMNQGYDNRTTVINNGYPLYKTYGNTEGVVITDTAKDPMYLSNAKKEVADVGELYVDANSSDNFKGVNYLSNSLNTSREQTNGGNSLDTLRDANSLRSQGLLNGVDSMESVDALNCSRMPADIMRFYLKEIFDRFPSNYSTKYRNPCWEEGDTLRCVPYFYQVGSYKCGSTDLWGKLVEHPSIIPVAKEIHWWAWRRFGFTGKPIHGPLVEKIRIETGLGDDRSLQWYFNFVSNQATSALREDPKLVFGDASISNLWGLADYNWRKHFPFCEEPPFYLADLIHALQPNAKITAIVRDPVEKLWTSYKLGAYKRMSIKRFFDNGLKTSQTCQSTYTEKYCAFVNYKSGPTATYQNYIDQGKYVLYLEEWVRTFGLKNIHVIRLEDWKNKTVEVLDGLIRYLELEPLSEETLSEIASGSIKNVNSKPPSDMTMTEAERRRIQNYYRPWNIRLAKLLNNPAYMWGY